MVAPDRFPRSRLRDRVVESLVRRTTSERPSLVKDLGPRARRVAHAATSAIGLAPRSSRFQKPEDVASKFARLARLRIATRWLGLKQRAEYLGPASFEVAVSLESAL